MTATETIKTEYPASLGDRDFYVTVKRYPEDGGHNAGQTWVLIEEHVFDAATPEIRGFNKFIADVNVEGEQNDLFAIRDAFNSLRHRLKQNARNWADNRHWAAMEKGGKRAYYTKHANFWHGQILAAAENWKLCKAIWKQITKL